MTSLSYSNEYISKTINLTDVYSNRVYKANTTTGLEISSVSDFINTSYNGGYYVLKSDIDLKGIDWVGLSFNGVLNGNGHKILNMSKVSSINNKNVSIGLFENASGYIFDLVVSDVTFIIDLNSENSEDDYEIALGIISARANQLVINNVTIIDSDIIIKNYSKGKTNVGGIIGVGSSIYLSNIYIDAAINTTLSKQYDGVGGLVGKLDGVGNNVISKVYNKISITVKQVSSMGGFPCGASSGVGILMNGSILLVENSCFNTNEKYESCENTGNPYGYLYVYGGYAIVDKTIFDVTNINSNLYFVNELNWSTEYWNITDTNIRLKIM